MSDWQPIETAPKDFPEPGSEADAPVWLTERR